MRLKTFRDCLAIAFTAIDKALLKSYPLHISKEVCLKLSKLGKVPKVMMSDLGTTDIALTAYE